MRGFLPRFKNHACRVHLAQFAGCILFSAAVDQEVVDHDATSGTNAKAVFGEFLLDHEVGAGS